MGSHEKALIITCDEFGECHSANQAIIAVMEKGLGIKDFCVGASIQMPAPWAAEAIQYAKSNPAADIGVHLTIEWTRESMKCRPLCDKSEVPGLYGPDGWFWAKGKDAWAHSNEEEIYKECNAQIEAALSAGIDVTHIDGHGSFQHLNYAGYCRVCGRLAEEYSLPLRMQSRQRYGAAAALRDEVISKGVLASDGDTAIGDKKRDESITAYYIRRIGSLTLGLTDLYTHPAFAGEELNALCGAKAHDRVAQYKLLMI